MLHSFIALYDCAPPVLSLANDFPDSSIITTTILDFLQGKQNLHSQNHHETSIEDCLHQSLEVFQKSHDQKSICKGTPIREREHSNLIG
jgi:hypothetical protein